MPHDQAGLGGGQGYHIAVNTEKRKSEVLGLRARSRARHLLAQNAFIHNDGFCSGALRENTSSGADISVEFSEGPIYADTLRENVARTSPVIRKNSKFGACILARALYRLGILVDEYAHGFTNDFGKHMLAENVVKIKPLM